MKAAEASRRKRIVTDAIMLALNREVEIEGKITKRLNVLADRVVLKAIEGDVPAFNAVADRVDGKPAQALELSGADGEDLSVTVTYVKPGDL